MIKLTNSVLIGLISASLLVGCGGSSNDNDDTQPETTEQVENEATENETTENEATENETTETSTETTATTTTTTTTVAFSFQSDVMPILTTKCQSCHGDNGNFKVTDASGTYANISALSGGASYMLGKGNGDIAHGGNDQLSDAEYSTIKSWIDAGAELN